MIRDVVILRTRPAALAVAAALALLSVFPPDVYGEACAALAALAALAAFAAAREIVPARASLFTLAALLAIPIARAAEAQGVAVRPLSALLVCAAAGIVAAALPLRVRSLSFWQGLVATAGAYAGARALWEVMFGLRAMRATAEAATTLVDRELVLGRIAEGRAYAGFPTPAALGGFLAITLAMTVGAAVARSGRARAILGAAALLQAGGLLASRSLTAAGALVAAILIYALGTRLDSHARRRLVAALAVLSVLLIAVIALRGRGAFDARVEGSPWALRAGNVRAAAAMAADHPWLGVGPGGFGEAYPRYRTATGNTTRRAHSLPFDLVAEMGVPLGVLLSVGFFVLFLGPVLRRPRDAAAAGAAVGLAAFAVQNLADFTALLPSTLGAAAIVRGLAARSDVPERQAAAFPSGAAFAIAALAAGFVFGLDGLGSEARRESRAAFAADDAGAALAAADRAIALAPWDPDARLFRAQILDASGDPGAFEEIERVVALVPGRPSARAVRARLRAGSGDLGGALVDLERAADLYPSNEEYARARDALARRMAGERP